MSDSHILGGSASAGPEGKQIESDVAAAHVPVQKTMTAGLIRSLLLEKKLLFHLDLVCISACFII